MKKSDLGVRTLSAIVMLAVAGVTLWLGGLFWAVFVGLIACGVLWEWRGLVRGFARTNRGRMVWNFAGLIYIAVACFTLLLWRSDFYGIAPVLMFIGAVIATDIGAYFAGRTIGGPKIAPRISPSKTWAGLGGGIIGASIVIAIYLRWSTCASSEMCDDLAFISELPAAILTGALIAIIAQAGDFFESWMKRRAGVKDSGALLPGHGGLFDRLDGLLAVAFVAALISGVFMMVPVQATHAEAVDLGIVQ